MNLNAHFVLKQELKNIIPFTFFNLNMNDSKDMEEPKNCVNIGECHESSTGDSTDSLNESIELSLPESFDDDISEFDRPFVQLPPATGAGATSVTNKVLEAKLRTSEERLEKLVKEKENLLLSLVQGISLSHDEIERIRIIPPSERSLFQVVVLAFHTGRTKEASNGTIFGGRQEEGHQHAGQHNIRVLPCDQQDHMLERSGKTVQSSCQIEEGNELVHDIVRNHHQQQHVWKSYLQNEIERLQQSLNIRQKELETAISNESEARSNAQILEKNIDNLRMENQFLQKEKVALMEKSEKCDARIINLERSLQEALSKVESLTKEITCATNIRSKEDHINEATREIKNVRNEFQKEISLYKKHVEAKFENQLNVLKEANARAVSQHERAINEVSRLKNIVESLDNDKDDKIIELERQNADLRSEIKLKCIECARFKSSSKVLEEEINDCRTKLQLAYDEVTAHKHVFKILESESLHERQRLKDELRRKNEQLEAYYEVQERNLSGTTVSATNTSKVTQLHLLDKTRSLNKKCNALQKQVLVLEEKLKQQDDRKPNTTQKSKGTNTNLLQLRQNQCQGYMENQEGCKSFTKGNDSTNPQDEMLSIKDSSEKPEKVFQTCQKYHYIVSSVQDASVRNMRDPQRDDNKWNTTGCNHPNLSFLELLMKHGVHHASVG